MEKIMQDLMEELMHDKDNREKMRKIIIEELDSERVRKEIQNGLADIVESTMDSLAEGPIIETVHKAIYEAIKEKFK